jgi:hypothetical protein
MKRFSYLRLLAAAAGTLAMKAPARAGPITPFALSLQIQYPTVIQGAMEPIYGFVYNLAPIGSPASNFQVSAGYGAGYTGMFGYYYSGPIPASGGTTYVTLPFPLNTTNLNPGTVPVQVTAANTSTGASISQGGQFTVLAHAQPALYLQGQIVPLSSKNVVTFAVPVFGEAPPTGTEAASGAFMPDMLGDPPGEPTAELDLDSISASGSPYITTTLAPFTDLPSNDDPSQGVPFQVSVFAPIGDYSTTFLLYYSDEQDLPGADPPGSELASFNVNVDVTSTTFYWTITTDPVPEPGTAMLATLGLFLLVVAVRRARV